MMMGAYDNTDLCDLTGLYVLDSILKKFSSVLFDIYRDDALTISSRAIFHTPDRLRRDLISTLASMRLRITIETNITMGDSLYVTLDLGSDAHMLYCKANEALLYTITTSCHSCIVFRNMVKCISKMISNLPYNQAFFDTTIPYYYEALADRELVNASPICRSTTTKRDITDIFGLQH